MTGKTRSQEKGPGDRLIGIKLLLPAMTLLIAGAVQIWTGLRETLEIYARCAIQRVTHRKVDKEAHKRGIVIQQRTEDMNSKELMGGIDICMELISPSTAKQHLAQQEGGHFITR